MTIPEHIDIDPPPDLEIHWIDRGRKATQPSDPAYPKGKDIDATNGAKSCLAVLACPAPRGKEDRQCGLWAIKCRRCGTMNIITTAGRADDPRSVRLPCRLH